MTDQPDPTGIGPAKLNAVTLSFLAAPLSFYAGSAILFIWSGTPLASTPLASISSHLLWFVAIALLSTGTVALIITNDTLAPGLSGYLSVGVLSLGVFLGLQWTTWTYVDVLASEHPQHEVLLDTIISPFGAGQALMYGMLLGAGIALLGWRLRQTEFVHEFIASAGVILGVLEVVGAIGVLLIATKGAPLFAMVLIMPLLYLWTTVVGFTLVRNEWHPNAKTLDAQNTTPTTH